MIFLSARKWMAVLIGGGLLCSCTRNEIAFGTLPDESYTELLLVDTVAVQFSTVFRDSFETNNVSTVLLGRYRDADLGTISGRLFTQFDIPAVKPEIPSTAVFDSVELILRPNKYYYGDTSQALTFLVQELDQTIVPTYSSFLYNTSSVPMKATILGTQRVVLRPSVTDSLRIRLLQNFGLDWFEKIRNGSETMGTATAFQNYFKGLSAGIVSGDIGAVYGFGAASGSIVIRLHYHHTFPSQEPYTIDFLNIQDELQFNQLLHDRTGTFLQSSGNEYTEIVSTASGNQAFMQPGMGIKLKATFPGLRTLLPERDLVKLLKAELILRPAYLSFDQGASRLPDRIYLLATDAGNLEGNPVLDSTSNGIQYRDPFMDNIYGENTHYRFNVTNNINGLLLSPGSERNGFFFRNEDTLSSVTRMVVNDRFSGLKTAELRLFVLLINK